MWRWLMKISCKYHAIVVGGCKVRRDCLGSAWSAFAGSEPRVDLVGKSHLAGLVNSAHLVGLVNTNSLVGKWQVSDHWIIRSTDLQILRSSGQQVSGSTILRSSDPQIKRSPELQNCRTAFWVLLSFTEICKENSQISRSVDSQIKRSPELQICKENLTEVCISFVC